MSSGNRSKRCYGLELLSKAAEYHNMNTVTVSSKKTRGIASPSTPLASSSPIKPDQFTKTVPIALPPKKRAKLILDSLGGRGVWPCKKLRFLPNGIKLSPVKTPSKSPGVQSHRAWERMDEYVMAATSARRFERLNLRVEKTKEQDPTFTKGAKARSS